MDGWIDEVMDRCMNQMMIDVLMIDGWMVGWMEFDKHESLIYDRQQL